MTYSPNFSQIRLAEFQEILASSEMLPQRLILHEQLQERFAILAAHGISNLKDLDQALKDKGKLKAFAGATGLPERYLVILRREVNSYQPSPVNLADFPGVAEGDTDRLAALGIKHSKHLYDQVEDNAALQALAAQTGIPGGRLRELYQLADLARIGGVGPVSARIFLNAGIDSPAALLASEPEALLERLNEFNDQHGLQNKPISKKDIAYCIQKARLLPTD